MVLVLALVAILASFPYTLPQYTPVPESAEGPLLSIEFELQYTDMRGMTAWTQEMPADSPLVEQYLAGGPLMTAEVLALDARSYPTEVAFEFEAPLEDSSLRWIWWDWDKHRYRPFPIPRIGETVHMVGPF